MPGGGTSGQGAGGADPSGRQTPSTPTVTTPSGLPAMPAARDTYGGPLPGQPRTTGLSDTQRKPTGTGSGIGGSGGVGAFGGGPGSRGVSTGGVNTGGNTALRGGGSVGTGPVPGQIPPGQGQAGRGGVGGPARGAAGTGGMPVSPAGRGNGEEDQEHRRKYLVHTNDKELFGTDEPYVPPVIGDNR
jgi:hypothetical protein